MSRTGRGGPGPGSLGRAGVGAGRPRPGGVGPEAWLGPRRSGPGALSRASPDALSPEASGRGEAPAGPELSGHGDLVCPCRTGGIRARGVRSGHVPPCGV